MNYDKIGLLIKNLRIKNNMSQNDLARELGIGRENISKWENGVSLPDVENLIIISKIFKVSVDELLLGELTNNKDNNKDIYYELYKEKNKKNESLRRNIKLFTSLVLVLSVSSILFISYFFYEAYNKSIDSEPNIVEVNKEENNEEETSKDLTYSSSLLNITKS